MDKKIHNNKIQEIPTFESQIGIIESKLKQDTLLGIVLVDTFYLDNIEIHFSDVIDYSILTSFKEFVKSMQGSFIRKDDLVTINIPDGNKYYIFLSKPRTKNMFEIKD